MIGRPKKKQSKSNPELNVLHRRLASHLHMKEEHVFAYMNNHWKSLSVKDKMKIYKKGEEVLYVLYMCFFLENCYICCCGNNMSKRLEQTLQHWRNILGILMKACSSLNILLILFYLRFSQLFRIILAFDCTFVERRQSNLAKYRLNIRPNNLSGYSKRH
jgi:hypothetical protein